MKTIIFYGRAQVGAVVLSYLVAKGYTVKVIPEDEMIKDLCRYYNLEIVNLDTMGEFDLFICCHGKKIIDEKYLKGKFINIHPCLWKYKGHDPIKRYIENKDIEASVESHYMVKEVDAGEVITRILFETPIINSYGEFYNLALPHYLQCIDGTLKRIWIKNAAITRVRDNMVMLELWLSYYSRYFNDLYVITYGELGADKLLEKYKFTILQQLDEDIDSGGLHSIKSLNLISETQKKLLRDHDWVLYSDVDEFVVPDPKYKDLKDFMLKSGEKQTFCEGYEIYQDEEEGGIDYSKPILQQRKYWVKDENGSYNKPLLSRIGSKWTHGFHKLKDMTDDEAKAIRDTGLYLLHLRDIDKENTIHVSFKRSEIPAKIRMIL